MEPKDVDRKVVALKEEMDRHFREQKAEYEARVAKLEEEVAFLRLDVDRLKESVTWFETDHRLKEEIV